jgi:phage shock protein PspC (stress-responsive transcriptional regulator)
METATESTGGAPERPAAVRRLTRPRDDRMLAGVCAGLGRYFDMSPVVYRLAFAVLALAGGTGILIYGAAWLVMPVEGEERSLAEQALRDRRERPALAIGLGLLALAAIVVLSHARVWPDPGGLWFAAVLLGAGLVWWDLHRGDRAPAEVAPPAGGSAPDAPTVVAPRQRRPSLLPPVAGALLAVGGILGLLEALGVGSIDWRVVLAAAVAAVGAAVVFGAATGRRVGGTIGLGLLLLAALVASLTLHVPLRGGVGDRTERPLALTDTRTYRLAVGELTVDLRDTATITDEAHVDAHVGVGHLVVYVPGDVEVEATGRTGAGDVVLFGSHESGVDVERERTVGSGPKRIVLDAEVGLGDVEVRRG